MTSAGCAATSSGRQTSARRIVPSRVGISTLVSMRKPVIASLRPALGEVADRGGAVVAYAVRDDRDVVVARLLAERGDGAPLGRPDGERVEREQPHRVLMGDLPDQLVGQVVDALPQELVRLRPGAV